MKKDFHVVYLYLFTFIFSLILGIFIPIYSFLNGGKVYLVLFWILGIGIPLLMYIKYRDIIQPLIYFPMAYTIYFSLSLFKPFEDQINIPYEMFGYYVIGLISFYFGSLIIHVVNSKRKKKLVLPKEISNKRKYRIYILFFLILFLIIYQYSKIGIPMFSENVEYVRSQIYGGYLNAIIQYYEVITFFAIFFIIQKLQKEKKIDKFSLFIITISVIVSLLNGSRTTLLSFISTGLIMYHFMIKRISLLKAVKFGIPIILIVSLIKFYRSYLEIGEIYIDIVKARDYPIIVSVLLSGFHSLRVGVENFYLLTETIPSNYSYQYGNLTLNSIISILPGNQETAGFFVKRILEMEFEGIGAASTILGLFYIEFGLLGIILGMMSVGIILQIIYVKVNNTNNIMLPMYAYFIYYSLLTLRFNVLPNFSPIMYIIYFISTMFIFKIKIKR